MVMIVINSFSFIVKRKHQVVWERNLFYLSCCCGLNSRCIEKKAKRLREKELKMAVMFVWLENDLQC